MGANISTEITRNIYMSEGDSYVLSSDRDYNFHRRYFDARLYHILAVSNNKGKDNSIGTVTGNEDFNFLHADNVDKGNALYIYPYHTYGNFSGDYYESEDSITEQISDLQAQLDAQLNAKQQDTSTREVAEHLASMIKELQDRRTMINDFNEHFNDKMLASHSLIHPYAIVKLSGAIGSKTTLEGSYLFDNFATRKWYEVDGDNISSYAKNPTTTRLIAWGNEDLEGRTPYSYQDFVFCKNWNVIPNNRMITLRRYFAPVTDNIEFDNYKEIGSLEEVLAITPDAKIGKNPRERHLWADASIEKVKNMGFSPLATAVTYFGEDTDNKLSDILNFKVAYNWEPIEAQSSPIDVDAHVNDAGGDLTSNDGKLGLLSSAMKTMSYLTGFTGALSGGPFNPMMSATNAIPPDPYKNGPYENRIIGPVNVIMNTVKRKRGLSFTQDGLKITFSYISRPIAGINNKAVLLDLMCNMLIMCYSSGTWFGGVERFRSSSNTLYPFKYGDVMTKLYKGQLFGRKGATHLMATHAWEMGTGNHGFKDIFGEALKDMKNLVSSMWNELMSVVHGAFGNSDEAKERKEQARSDFNSAMGGTVVKGIQKVLAGRILKGATIPWVQGKKALLTGDPTGEWHLTIGNPLNPIAMIGNLVCDGLEIKWSDELGPDDFPIGFDAVVSLKHGLGRDRDAVESMFNRGFGRIYSLPTEFRKSADFESKVDQHTGNTQNGRRYGEWSSTYFGGGGAYVSDIEVSMLKNRGSNRSFELHRYKSLMPAKEQNSTFRMSTYAVTPFQIQWLL